MFSSKGAIAFRKKDRNRENNFIRGLQLELAFCREMLFLGGKDHFLKGRTKVSIEKLKMGGFVLHVCLFYM